jgi:hypothetical protein
VLTIWPVATMPAGAVVGAPGVEKPKLCEPPLWTQGLKFSEESVAGTWT